MPRFMKITVDSQSWPLLVLDFQLQPKGCAFQSNTKIASTLRPLWAKFL